MSAQGARVIDLDEYRRRRAARREQAAPAPAIPPVLWVPVWMWVPVHGGPLPAAPAQGYWPFR
jgi:hypothetical protein